MKPSLPVEASEDHYPSPRSRRLSLFVESPIMMLHVELSPKCFWARLSVVLLLVVLAVQAEKRTGGSNISILATAVENEEAAGDAFQQASSITTNEADKVPRGKWHSHDNDDSNIDGGNAGSMTASGERRLSFPTPPDDIILTEFPETRPKKCEEIERNIKERSCASFAQACSAATAGYPPSHIRMCIDPFAGGGVVNMLDGGGMTSSTIMLCSAGFPFFSTACPGGGEVVTSTQLCCLFTWTALSGLPLPAPTQTPSTTPSRAPTKSPSPSPSSTKPATSPSPTTATEQQSPSPVGNSSADSSSSATGVQPTTPNPPLPTPTLADSSSSAAATSPILGGVGSRHSWYALFFRLAQAGFVVWGSWIYCYGMLA